jgi:glycosyltransferase involved in cell wall biosynthesis
MKLLMQRKGVRLFIFLVFVLSFYQRCTLANKSIHKDSTSKKILFCIWNSSAALNKKGEKLSSDARRMRGSSVYKMNLFKHIVHAGVPAVALVINDTELERDLKQQGYACYGCRVAEKKWAMLTATIKDICKKEKIDIVHCHGSTEMLHAIYAAREYPVKIVRTLHTDTQLYEAALRNVDGVMCVSPQSEALFKKINKEKHLDMKHIMWTAPFFDEQRFMSFIPTLDKNTFFKETFGIALKDCPMICCVSNFYPGFKNHKVLLKAIAQLLFVHHISAQLVLAGDGPRFEEMKALAQSLGIQDYVYFLGQTDKTPEIYYYSDVNALTSNSEAFGIVLLEGSLLKKPMIGTAGTGMEAVVKDSKTGFLFKKNDVNDLVRQLKKIIVDRSLAEMLGQNAYTYVMDNYVSAVTIQKLKAFYVDVLSGK